MTTKTKIIAAVIAVAAVGVSTYFLGGEYFQGKMAMDLSKPKEIKEIAEVKKADEKTDPYDLPTYDVGEPSFSDESSGQSDEWYEEYTRKIVGYDLPSAEDIKLFQVPEGMFDFSLCNVTTPTFIYDETSWDSMFKTGEFIEFYNYIKSELERNGGKLTCPLAVTVEYKIKITDAYMESTEGDVKKSEYFFIDRDDITAESSLAYDNVYQYTVEFKARYGNNDYFVTLYMTDGETAPNVYIAQLSDRNESSGYTQSLDVFDAAADVSVAYISGE